MLTSTRFTILTTVLLNVGWANLAQAQWPDPNVYYKIKSRWGSCLDMRRINRAKVGSCADVSREYWRFTPMGNGFFHLTTLAWGRGMCLDVGGADNTSILLTPCANSSGQLWRVIGGPIASRISDPASVRLTTKLRGSGWCLRQGHYNLAYLGSCQDKYERQSWYLRRTNLEVNWLTRKE